MSLTRQFTQSITYAEQDGLTDSGQPEFGSKRTVKGRHDKNTRRIIDPEGNERDVSDKIVTKVLIPMGSEVWVPGDNLSEPAKHRPIAVMAAVSFRGEEIFETWL